ncbi:omega-amino acid--pyruvate aminotransferase [Burkholderia pseudomallei]|nr:conserved hypothetical protein [Burkholderia pseudomallei MSHR346]AUG20197.1 omega-amino acid--pyruvate aminotransferase [Burkholderia pseudomallei]EDO86049.1 hypothetical protein BURPS406E_K0083 [Burkholderia pseudomallei 406e]EEC36411.1 conserved hypothetical protein [Burkholderia pseudomallei 576]EEH30078.1 conserved hypothetical protein [Burkholderia pseudomallei Pakistan 9]PNW94032.1 omega-amino acid--pyruvate aminotransferase [Burkholderia sp. 136(2017)]PNX10820.1 omega-amino acid--p
MAERLARRGAGHPSGIAPPPPHGCAASDTPARLRACSTVCGFARARQSADRPMRGAAAGMRARRFAPPAVSPFAIPAAVIMM